MKKKVNFTRAPKVGEHTKEVLKQYGLSDEELNDLKENNSVYWPEN